MKSRIYSNMRTYFLLSTWNSGNSWTMSPVRWGYLNSQVDSTMIMELRCVSFQKYNEVEVDCSGQGAARYHRALAMAVEDSTREQEERAAMAEGVAWGKGHHNS